MLYLTNCSDLPDDVGRFDGEEEVRAFCARTKIDGFELLALGGGGLGPVPRELVIGVHLLYYPCFVDLWNGNEAGVVVEFGSVAEAQKRLGSRAQMIGRLRAQLDWAQEIGAKYVVFHVSDVSLAETVTGMRLHSDEAVVDAALAWLRAAVRQEYRFEFLVENLWWPGFDFLRPEITRELLEGVPLRRKGIMLDVGHLMHTSPTIASQEEGTAFVLRQFARHGALCAQIRGLHLHQWVEGSAYRSALGKNPPQLHGDYAQRLSQAYGHVLRMDAHRPFSSPCVRRIVQSAAPEYLVHELITRDRAEHESFLHTQNKALGKG